MKEIFKSWGCRNDGKRPNNYSYGIYLQVMFSLHTEATILYVPILPATELTGTNYFLVGVVWSLHMA